MRADIKIPFGYPSIDNEEIEAVKKVLDSKWLTTGNEALHFEKEFNNFLNMPNLFTLAVQSCTAGLHLAYLALNTTRGHTVISTPLTFVSSVMPAIHCGAKIEFIDCAPNSMYPSVESLERLTKDLSHHSITLVPLAGYHPHYIDLCNEALKRKLYVIEDVAHAFPAMVSDTIGDMPYGTLGDIGVYSFYANKTITTGEGGMLVCKNQLYNHTMTLLRNHGINKTTWERYNSAPDQVLYDVITPGFKYNLPDLLATIGRVQLKKARDLHKKRIQIAKFYLTILSQRDYIILPEHPRDLSLHSWHLFCIQIKHKRLSRNDFMLKLAEKGIGTSIHYTPLHLMSYFKYAYGYKPKDLPNALDMFQNLLSIPLYPDLSLDAQEYICNTIIEIGDNN